MKDNATGRTLRDFTRILFQRWFLIASLVCLCTAGTWAYCTFILPQFYRSKISLIFKRPPPANAVGGEQTGDAGLGAFVRAQQQIVMSDLVLARAKVISEDAMLRNNWYAIRESYRNADKGEAFAAARSKIDAFLMGTVDERVKKLLAEMPAQFDEFRAHVGLDLSGVESTAMADSFSLIVDRPGVRNEAESYKNAKHAADVLADMYIVRFQELQRELSEPAVRVMGDVIADYARYVSEKQGEYEKFVKENPGDIGMLEQLMKSPGERNEQNLLTKVRENDATLSMDHARDKAIYDVLIKVLPPKSLEPNGVDALSSEEVKAAVADTPADFLLADSGMTEIQKQLAKLTARKAKLETQFTPESREMRNVNAEIERSMRQMLEQIVGRARSLRATVEAREHQLAMNRELMAKTENEQNDIHRKLVTYSRLKNDYQVAENHLAELRREQREAVSNTLQAREAVTISKLSEASMPDMHQPVSPRTSTYAQVAFALSLVAGLLIAFMLDRFDHTFRSSRDAERYIGLPVLGSVKKQRDGLVSC